MFDFAREMYFDEKAFDEENTRDKSVLRFFQSPAFKARSLKEANTIWLSSDPNELCDRLKLLLQEKQVGNNSEIINEELIVIAENRLEKKCIS